MKKLSVWEKNTYQNKLRKTPSCITSSALRPRIMMLDMICTQICTMLNGIFKLLTMILICLYLLTCGFNDKLLIS